jgi:hypothetical protein
MLTGKQMRSESGSPAQTLLACSGIRWTGADFPTQAPVVDERKGNWRAATTARGSRPVCFRDDQCLSPQRNARAQQRPRGEAGTSATVYSVPLAKTPTTLPVCTPKTSSLTIPIFKRSRNPSGAKGEKCGADGAAVRQGYASRLTISVSRNYGCRIRPTGAIATV